MSEGIYNAGRMLNSLRKDQGLVDSSQGPSFYPKSNKKNLNKLFSDKEGCNGRIQAPH